MAAATPSARAFLPHLLASTVALPYAATYQLLLYGGGDKQSFNKYRKKVGGGCRACVGFVDDGNDERRKESDGGANEAEMRRIAEIVLVLSAIGTMRGGKNPTAPEKAMMAEARAIAVSICEELAPKDIVPREPFGGIIEDLDLNRMKEHRLGLRPPKQSIVEKMESSKRRVSFCGVYFVCFIIPSAYMNPIYMNIVREVVIVPI